MTVRVLLADDQALIRGGFAALIDSADDLASPGRPSTARTRSGRPAPCGPTSC